MDYRRIYVTRRSGAEQSVTTMMSVCSVLVNAGPASGRQATEQDRKPRTKEIREKARCSGCVDGDYVCLGQQWRVSSVRSSERRG